MSFIYHITAQAEWQIAKSTGIYETESLSTEGFIHCTTEELFEQVANFYFKGARGIIVLEIDPERLTADLRWEEVGPNKFPHVYGPIIVDAVTRTAELTENEDGLFEFPFKPLLH